jgi:GAF domain-containing protein
LINIVRPASPFRYLTDIVLGLVGSSSVIQTQGLTFLEYLMEMNSSGVQSDLLERVEESQGQWEADIRKLLHEVSRSATAALEHARLAKNRGTAAVEGKLQRISRWSEKSVTSRICLT